MSRVVGGEEKWDDLDMYDIHQERDTDYNYSNASCKPCIFIIFDDSTNEEGLANRFLKSYTISHFNKLEPLWLSTKPGMAGQDDA